MIGTVADVLTIIFYRLPDEKNRKILEELQKKQHLLKKQSTVDGKPTLEDQSIKSDPLLGGGGSQSSRERVALAHALNNSFGYFISQDSAFGNLILPVLPRVSPSS